MTGAGSGIGRAIARRVAAEGARVVVADIDPAGGSETVELVTMNGGIAVFTSCDVAEPAAAPALVRSALDTFGQLDGAVNNAGVTTKGSFSLVDTPVALWDDMLRVNLSGMFFMLQAQLRHFRDHGGGAIVTMASMTSLVPVPGITAYGASKAGVVALTRQAAAEHVDDGIRVNAVAPGVVRTPIFDDAPPERMAARLALQPGGRLAEPEEIASVTAFLLSDDASFVHGQVVSVDMVATLFRGWVR